MFADAPTRQSLRIAALYAFFAVGWILFSDRLLGWLCRDPQTFILAASIKGSAFVLITATMLFVLVRRQLKSVAGTAEARRKAEEAVRISEERFRALAALSPDIISIFDREGRLIFNSSSAFRIHGYRNEELLGRRTFDLIHPADVAAVQAAFAAALKDPSRHVLVRYRYRNANGTYTWMEAAGRNELDNPHLQGVIAISRDISDRLRGEEILRESEARLRRAEEVAGLGHWTLHLATREVVFSVGAQRLFGVTSARLKAAAVRNFILPESLPALGSPLRELIEQGKPYDVEFKLRRASDGKVVDIHALGQLDAVGRIVFGTIQDVSERKRSEAILRLESAALEAAANAIAITDRQGRLVWINSAFTTLTGYASAEAHGRTPGELLGSGKHDRQFFAEMWASILSDKPWHGVVINRRKDGTLYQEEQTITPVHDEKNAITHFVAIKQDITARRMLEAQVYRSQRLDSIGCLAGGIAHDLNNILSPILLAPDLLREVVKDPQSAATIDAIELSVKRGSAVIRQLLTFSRGGDVNGDHVLVQWRHIVRDMVNIMRETFPKNIKVVQKISGDVWLVPADATQLHQVLMNLCVNARDAMPSGGTLTITLENAVLSEAETAGSTDARPGPHVMLRVTDTGMGIAPEHLDKVYDPFFTTKEVGKGTGLGLSSVLGIVRGHRGVIQVSSKVGEGTQFKIYLPASRAETELAHKSAPANFSSGAGKCILLIDDEDTVRKLTGRILERQGYRVIAATNGAEGLAIFKQRCREIAVVITDLLMPVMDGHALIRQLRGIDPAARIIAISGYLGKAAQRDEAGLESVLVISKPFATEELLDALQRVLPVNEPSAN